MTPAAITSVHVHDAEVSTDRDALATYAEPLAVLLAVAALVAASWIASSPRGTADLQQPSQAQPTQFEAAGPGASFTSVTVDPDATAAGTFAASLQAPLQGPSIDDRTPTYVAPRQGPPLPPYLG